MIALLALAGAQLAQPAPATPPPPLSEQSVVVTAQRIGVPVWRVRRGGSTLVLIATIPDIAKGTAWNAEALDRTISEADRLMFPEMVGLGASPFQLIGWLAKWKRMAKLPRGQSLSAMISSTDRARIERLAAAGIAPRDWDRYHPLHLGQRMQDIVRKEAGKGATIASVVQRSASRHKVPRVPIASSRASPLVNDLFASSPREHVPCLRASLDFAEGGAGEIRRRSMAWASRQVASAARSPLDAVYDDCFPGTTKSPGARDRVLGSMNGVLASGNETVVAVFDLQSLAGPDGVLDRLQRSGADISGPAWK